jgi:ribose transport system ATP-binding protein
MDDLTSYEAGGRFTGPAPLLQVEGLSKSFGGVRALTNARLEVVPGEIHTVFGENGAGKSTLVKIIAGVLQPDAGRIVWGGDEISRLDIAGAAQLGIRIIYQHLSNIAHLSVRENLFLGREWTRWGVIQGGKERREAQAVLDRVGIDLDLDRQAGTLPVAERQLLEIARSLQGDVRLLVMDEPTASLGDREVERLFTVVRGLRQQGVAIIFISHKLGEVMEISDRVTVLRDGQTIGTVRGNAMSPEQLVEMMVGRDMSHGFAVQRSEPLNEVLLEVKDLWTDTGLRGVSFDLRCGEVLGVYGLMGSGRSELARALFGADRMVGGQLRFQGQPYVPRSPADAKRLGIGLAPEERSDAIFDNISVRENISSASGDLIAHLGIIRRAFEQQLSQQVVDVLRVRTPTVEAPIRSLSGGNQQKVVLGKWLMRQARLLILDDPTAGVDVGTKLEIYQIISKMTQDGTSIIMSSSELPELLAISNRILVLHQGRVAGILEGDGMTERNVLHLAVRGVHAAGSNHP